MAELKTKVNEASVTAFLNTVTDEKKRSDCKAIIALMEQITGHKAKMWGASIIGFDSYHYKYASGHEGDMCLAGFSPRKQNITIYLMAGFTGHSGLLKKLGKHKTAKACLYINTLDDININVLRELIELSIKDVKKQIEKMKGS